MKNLKIDTKKKTIKMMTMIHKIVENKKKAFLQNHHQNLEEITEKKIKKVEITLNLHKNLDNLKREFLLQNLNLVVVNHQKAIVITK